MENSLLFPAIRSGAVQLLSSCVPQQWLFRITDVARLAQAMTHLTNDC